MPRNDRWGFSVHDTKNLRVKVENSDVLKEKKKQLASVSEAHNLLLYEKIYKNAYKPIKQNCNW